MLDENGVPTPILRPYKLRKHGYDVFDDPY